MRTPWKPVGDCKIQESPYVFPMQLDISSDGHHAAPWQRVLALSILELMTHLDTRLTVQMQALCRKLRPSLGSTFHIVSRLVVRSMNVNATERLVNYSFLPIRMIFRQLLSFIYSSITS